ncbi:unnamed protein product, partial [Prorocentrum cordatum]
ALAASLAVRPAAAAAAGGRGGRATGAGRRGEARAPAEGELWDELERLREDSAAALRGHSAEVSAACEAGRLQTLKISEAVAEMGRELSRRVGAAEAQVGAQARRLQELEALCASEGAANEGLRALEAELSAVAERLRLQADASQAQASRLEALEHAAAARARPRGDEPPQGPEERVACQDQATAEQGEQLRRQMAELRAELRSKLRLGLGGTLKAAMDELRSGLEDLSRRVDGLSAVAQAPGTHAARPGDADAPPARAAAEHRQQSHERPAPRRPGSPAPRGPSESPAPRRGAPAPALRRAASGQAAQFAALRGGQQEADLLEERPVSPASAPTAPAASLDSASPPSTSAQSSCAAPAAASPQLAAVPEARCGALPSSLRLPLDRALGRRPADVGLLAELPPPDVPIHRDPEDLQDLPREAGLPAGLLEPRACEDTGSTTGTAEPAVAVGAAADAADRGSPLQPRAPVAPLPLEDQGHSWAPEGPQVEPASPPPPAASPPARELSAASSLAVSGAGLCLRSPSLQRVLGGLSADTAAPASADGERGSLLQPRALGAPLPGGAAPAVEQRRPWAPEGPAVERAAPLSRCASGTVAAADAGGGLRLRSLSPQRVMGGLSANTAPASARASRARHLLPGPGAAHGGGEAAGVHSMARIASAGQLVARAAACTAAAPPPVKAAFPAAHAARGSLASPMADARGIGSPWGSVLHAAARAATPAVDRAQVVALPGRSLSTSRLAGAAAAPPPPLAASGPRGAHGLAAPASPLHGAGCVGRRGPSGARRAVGSAEGVTCAARFPVLVWEIALRSWRRFFPVRQGFQHLLWSDDNLTECVREEFPQHLGGFLALPGGIERSDAGRYCVMHRHGGIYADLDYEARTEFFGDLMPGLASLLECRSKDAGIDVENSLMASPPGHELWRLALARIFGSSPSGARRWDDPSSGTGPRMLTALLRGADASALGVRVLPCSLYQRSVAADSGEGHCGRVLDAHAVHQRGIHWSTTSHTSFVGAALRSERTFALHPELLGRPLFRGPDLVHRVAAASQGADPSAPRSEAERARLRGACLEARATGWRHPQRSCCGARSPRSPRPPTCATCSAAPSRPRAAPRRPWRSTAAPSCWTPRSPPRARPQSSRPSAARPGRRSRRSAPPCSAPATGPAVRRAGRTAPETAQAAGAPGRPRRVFSVGPRPSAAASAPGRASAQVALLPRGAQDSRKFVARRGLGREALQRLAGTTAAHVCQWRRGGHGVARSGISTP